MFFFVASNHNFCSPSFFELDKKYDDIFEARKATRAFVEKVQEKVTNSSLKEEEFLPALTKSLEDTLKTNRDEYYHIKQVLDFCEVVGYLMTCNYIDIVDVKGLWGPAIETWGTWFRSHIIWRQQNEGDEVFKYALLTWDELSRQNQWRSSRRMTGTRRQGDPTIVFDTYRWAPKDWARYAAPKRELQDEAAPGYPPDAFKLRVLDWMHRGRGRLIYE